MTSYMANNAGLLQAIETANRLAAILRSLPNCKNNPISIMTRLEQLKLEAGQLAEFAERRLCAQRLMVARRRIKREQAAAEVRP
jgi:hypothetical protein